MGYRPTIPFDALRMAAVMEQLHAPLPEGDGDGPETQRGGISPTELAERRQSRRERQLRQRAA